MIKSFKPFEEEESNLTYLKKGEKVVLVEANFSFPIHLTVGKIYTIIKDSNPDFSIWIESDIGLEAGYLVRSYTFKRLKEVRKEKIVKLNDNSR